MDLQILPLAITMMAGPQIMSAIILVTTRSPVRVSLAFLLGVAVAATLGVSIARGIFALVGGGSSMGDPSDSGSAGNIVQLVLVVLLLVAALRNYVKRATIEPPHWLGTLMDAGPRKALTTGFLVILLMPSDLVVMLTVGAHLEQHDLGVAAALPFIGLTVLVAALPLLLLLLVHRRAVRAMPAVRTWMNTHAWLINIICCLVFIVLIL
ncbi:GAP family protein [Actinomadura graeca]|uniref:GAP family protein n=1 Tax=Actinomadura graeca TaxID=2750812 RepID=A0ABX8QWW0_9ACTN|nr:GAP family protein [Actinomadura graeca]QXJ22654.1 GAP family protein [Actinomadura graeca]